MIIPRPGHYLHVELDAFVVMPNHVHGIVVIDYEHIIRDERELHRTREYIINNPARWESDRENPLRGDAS